MPWKKNDNNINLSYCYENLGKLCDKIGNHKESELHYRKCLDINVKNIDCKQITEEDIYVSYFNLATSLENQYKYTEASLNYEEALEGFERIYGHDNIKTFECYNYLAEINYKINKFEESLNYLTKSLLSCKLIYGEHNENNNLILQRINLCMSKMNLWNLRKMNSELWIIKYKK